MDNVEKWRLFNNEFYVSTYGNIKDLEGNPIKIYNTRYLSFRKNNKPVVNIIGNG